MWPFFVFLFSIGALLRNGMVFRMKLLSICENRDFRRVYAKGKLFISPILIVYVLKNPYETVRIGITTSKKTGNAVKRNRSRRIIKESFRKIFPQVKNGYDIIFVARARTSCVKSTDIYEIMKRQLAEAGILKLSSESILKS